MFKAKSYQALLTSLCLLTATSFSSEASDSSLASNKFDYIQYDLVSNNGNYNFSEVIDPTNSSHVIVVNGVQIKVGLTAWSDTADANGLTDRVVEQTNITNWEGGLTITNKDSSNDSHYIDNFKGGDDFDMILLSFDKDVILSQATFNAVNGNNGSKEITVAGLDDSAVPLFSSSSTWDDIARKSLTGTLGHFGINNGTSSFSSLTKAAKYWLVGAYNIYFDKNSDQYSSVGFKLSTLTVGHSVNSPTTEVSEPGALALMSLGLGLLLYRRKGRV